MTIKHTSFLLPHCAYHLPAPGLLRLTGPDRVAFLQRQTTNDVQRLAPNRAVTTVLTSPTARILDVLQLFEEDETIHILPLPGHAETTFNHLRRRIFFNDQVTLTNVSDEIYLLDLEGELAGAWLAEQGLEPPPVDGVNRGALAETALRVIGQPGLSGPGFRLLTPATQGAQLLDHLTHAGIAALTPEAYEIHRIEAGLPAVNHELTEDYTPHETNLAAWISETKGCYTGQEILARQVTYDKITRHLVGLKLDAVAQPGATVLAEGKSAGAITSAVLSPRLGPIALGILKRPHHEPGTVVTIENATNEISATVSPLPFLPFPK